MQFGFPVFDSKTGSFSWFCLSLYIQFGHKPWIVCLSLHIWKCWDIILYGTATYGTATYCTATYRTATYHTATYCAATYCTATYFIATQRTATQRCNIPYCNTAHCNIVSDSAAYAYTHTLYIYIHTHSLPSACELRKGKGAMVLPVFACQPTHKGNAPEKHSYLWQEKFKRHSLIWQATFMGIRWDKCTVVVETRLAKVQVERHTDI